MFQKFLLDNEKLMNQIGHRELIELIKFSAPGLEDFLDNSVTTIEIENNLGVLDGENHKKFIYQQELRTNRIYNQVCVKNA